MAGLCQEGDNLRKSCEVGAGTSITSLSQIWELISTAPVSRNISDSRPETTGMTGRWACTWEGTVLAPGVILRCGQRNSRVVGPMPVLPSNLLHFFLPSVAVPPGMSCGVAFSQSSVSHLGKKIPPVREAHELMLVQTVKCIGLTLFPARLGLSQLFSLFPGPPSELESRARENGPWSHSVSECYVSRSIFSQDICPGCILIDCHL